MNNIHFPSVAKNIVMGKKLKRAFKYDLFVREYDNMVEVVGFVNDPTMNSDDYTGPSALFPKKWVTLDVITKSEMEQYNA
jgi:hypothetical protein